MGLRTSRKAQTFKFKPFSPRQQKIMSWWTDGSPHQDMDGIVADGAIRAGKTLPMSLSFVLWAMERFDGENFAMCGKTIGAFRRNVLRNLLRILRARGAIVEDRRTDNEVTVQYNGHVNSFFIFGGRDERSSELIQGFTLAGVFFDEVALMPESFVNQAIGRCSVEGAKLWFNCNPEGPMHWFKVKWINKFKTQNLYYLHFTMDDNPSLSEGIKQKYRRRFSGVFFKRFILGLWVAAEGAIYDMFDRDRHVVDKAPPITRLWVSVDYGHTNATAFLLLGEGIDGRLYVLREYYHPNGEQGQKSPRKYSEEMNKFLAQALVYTDALFEGVIVDPSAKGFINQLREDGVPSVRTANNNVLEGIQLTSSLMEYGMLLVLRSCTHLIEELQAYVWDQKAAERGEDKPVKVNDHCPDALRYGIMDARHYWKEQVSCGKSSKVAS